MGPNLDFQVGMVVLLHRNCSLVFVLFCFFPFLQLCGQGWTAPRSIAGITALQQCPLLCDSTDARPGETEEASSSPYSRQSGPRCEVGVDTTQLSGAHLRRGHGRGRLKPGPRTVPGPGQSGSLRPLSPAGRGARRFAAGAPCAFSPSPQNVFLFLKNELVAPAGLVSGAGSRT